MFFRHRVFFFCSNADVIRKNKVRVKDNPDKMELHIDQASMKACAQIRDKRF